MPFSTVINEHDEIAAQFIRDRLYRIGEMKKELDREDKALRRAWSTMRICERCSGGGTICEGRTAHDMPDYQVCFECGGKGHNRTGGPP